MLAQLANRQQFTTLLAQLADQQQFTGYSKVSKAHQIGSHSWPLNLQVRLYTDALSLASEPGTVKHPAESVNLFETRTPFSVALHMFLARASPFHSLDKAVILQAIQSLSNNSHSASEAVSRCFQHNFQGQEKGLSTNTANTSQAHTQQLPDARRISWGTENSALFICCPMLSLSQLESSWRWFLATSTGTGGCWKGRLPNLF